MKKIAFIITLIFGVSIGFIVLGCAPKSGNYGKPLTEKEATTVAELFKAPDKFAGKIVRLEGKIVQECPSGGWFMLKDDTGVVLVDLHPSEVAIPQAVNHRVATQGKVKKEYSQISLVGEGVDLK
ncbi:MAG: hypothetical protein ABSB18_05140 [Candidatus Omnitrophota bacterium]